MNAMRMFSPIFRFKIFFFPPLFVCVFHTQYPYLVCVFLAANNNNNNKRNTISLFIHIFRARKLIWPLLLQMTMVFLFFFHFWANNLHFGFFPWYLLCVCFILAIYFFFPRLSMAKAAHSTEYVLSQCADGMSRILKGDGNMCMHGKWMDRHLALFCSHSLCFYLVISRSKAFENCILAKLR